MVRDLNRRCDLTYRENAMRTSRSRFAQRRVGAHGRSGAFSPAITCCTSLRAVFADMPSGSSALVLAIEPPPMVRIRHWPRSDRRSASPPPSPSVQSTSAKPPAMAIGQTTGAMTKSCSSSASRTTTAVIRSRVVEHVVFALHPARVNPTRYRVRNALARERESLGSIRFRVLRSG